MPRLEPLLRDFTGFTRDTARDRLSRGMLWDLIDYIPQFADAPLRARGGWQYQSNALPSPAQGLIFAPYKAGDRLLAPLDSGAMADVNINTVGHSIIAPVVPSTRQNPVFYNDYVYVFHKDGTSLPMGVTWTGSGYTNLALPGTAPPGRYGAIYRDRMVSAAPASNERLVAFSKPTNPQAAWEPLSNQVVSQPVRGLAVMRNAVLVFHKGAVSRIRGTTPPDPTLSSPEGDMSIDMLDGRVGCFDARSIAYWNDNVIWADERGVHITDGGLVRNLVSQGGILSLWRQAFQNAVSVAGTTFLDFYIVTVRTSDKPPLTLVCNIPTRLWFRVTNVDASCMTTSVGFFERLWGGDMRQLRVNALSPMFFPDTDLLNVDGDGVNVLPVIETGWGRLGRESKKRVRSLYVSYDCRLPDTARTPALAVGYIDSPEARVFKNASRPLNGTPKYTRRRIPIRLGSYGAAFRLQQIQAGYDLRLYDMSVESWAQEEGYL